MLLFNIKSFLIALWFFYCVCVCVCLSGSNGHLGEAREMKIVHNSTTGAGCKPKEPKLKKQGAYVRSKLEIEMNR
jgi:hypothetical protein